MSAMNGEEQNPEGRPVRRSQRSPSESITPFVNGILVFFAEATAATIFIFVGCMGYVENIPYVRDEVGKALCFGVAAFIASQIFWRFSGGHVNPMLTIVSVFFRHIKFYMAPVYFAAQIGGSISGLVLLKWVTPIHRLENASYREIGLCTTAVAPDVSILHMVVIEFFLSCVLSLVACSFWDARNRFRNLGSIKYAFVTYALIYAAGSYTGSSLNPVRSLAAAILNNFWEHHWMCSVMCVCCEMLPKDDDDVGRLKSAAQRWTTVPIRQVSMELAAAGAGATRSPGHIQRLLKLDDRRFEILIRTIRNFFSELFATGVLVFLGCMGVVKGLGEPGDHTGVVLSFALAVYTAVQIACHNSGGHVNPAVTVLSLFFKKISIPMAIVYIVAQLIGGVLGFGLLVFITPSDLINVGHADGLCTNVPNPNLSLLQAFVAEFALSALLMMIVCSVWDPRNHSHDSATLKFGFTIYSLAYAGVSYSGCGMNPARSLGPAVWNNVWKDHWIYWVGPFLASVVCGFCYTFFYCPRIEPPPRPQPTT